MNLYQNTYNDCIRWTQEKSELFTQVLNSLGYNAKTWRNAPTDERVKITFICFNLYLESQQSVMGA